MANCSAHKNETESECIIKDYQESKIPPTIQCIVGIIGNGMAIIILIRSSKTHKWKPFYRLVLALAITDIIVSAIGYPVVLKRYYSNFTYCLTVYECYHVSFTYSFSFIGSALLVTSLSIDRFIAVVFPFIYNGDTMMIRTTILIAGSWIIGTIICMLPIIGVGKPKLYYPGSWCFINFSSKETWNMVGSYIYAILGVIVLLITATVNTIVIVTLLRRMAQSKSKLGVKTRLKSDIYIIIFLLGVVLVFSVCWIPLISRMIYNNIIDCPEDGKMELLVARLAINNSLIDPWIYIVLRKENFELLERLIRHCKRNSITEETTRTGSRPSVGSSHSRDMTKQSDTDTNQMSNVGDNGQTESAVSTECK